VNRAAPRSTPYPAMKRYFLSRDNSARWYLVDAEKRPEWNAWNDLDPNDPAGREPPKFARRLEVSPECVTFTDPKQNE
jgi:hypothetical protein